MHYMHHSIFSMIAAVGSRSDNRSRFDESSESDGEPEEPSAQTRNQETGDSTQDQKPQSTSDERGRAHRRSLLDHRIPSLLSPHRHVGPRRAHGSMSQANTHVSGERSRSRIRAGHNRSRSMVARPIPVLSKMVEAQARFVTEKFSPGHTRDSSRERSDAEPQRPTSSSLSERLMEIFGFEKPENVIVEYPCSLLQSMLLQGYMYVTEGHVCFYAYFPKKSTATIKSGYLSKRGRNNPSYKRYWFSLKGDVLTYYKDWSKLYFPHGHVDLRYGISASLAEKKDNQKDVKDFQVTTDQGNFYFRADSPASANEWVKALQKVIFRTHNDGDSVKISCPIENIIDVDESSMVDFADTIKLRVVETGDLYGIDEVQYCVHLSAVIVQPAVLTFHSTFSLSQIPVMKPTSY